MMSTNRRQDGPSGAELTLSEWDRSPALQLSDRDLAFLSDEVGDRIAVEYHAGTPPTLRTKQHVGIINLPDGPTIEIRPKRAGGNLIHLIRYARGMAPDLVATPTPSTPGRRIIDTLASLFLAELEMTLRQGLQKAYVERRGAVAHLRGQVNVHRQIQRQGPRSTRLECDFEELTTDTPLNQAVLAATELLSGLVDNVGLRSELNLWSQRLQGHVTARMIAPEELEVIQLTRLDAHYTDLLALTSWVLAGAFVKDLRAGPNRAHALLINMDDVFEGVVERATRRALRMKPGWSVAGQETTTDLLDRISGGKKIRLRPDIIIRRNDEVVAVADAKWKTTIKNPDIYQLVAYQTAYNAPGLLIYPACGGKLRADYRVHGGDRLRLVELPTARSFDGINEMGKALEDTVADEVANVLREET